MSETITALTDKLLALRRQLHEEGTHPKDALTILRQATSHMDVALLQGDRDDAVIVDEALRRRLSCLRWIDDATLLDEAERRGVAHIQSEMSAKDFRAEAHKRGFRQKLSDFPLNEVRTYLRIQDGDY